MNRPGPRSIYRTFVQFLAPAALVVSAGGCAHGDLPPATVATGDYRLGRDDLVDVEVWKEAALSATVPVRPDGKISLPMTGELVAEGRTTSEIREEVTRRLRPFVPDPAVSVMVKEVKASRFFVLGEVAHPGVYPLSGPLTVLEAVAVAGGPTEFARTGHLVVIRRDKSREKPFRFEVSLDDIVGGKQPPLSLLAGDTVYVP